MGRGVYSLRPFFMDIIIPKIQTYSDGELNKALERELRTGLQLKKETERYREIRSAKEAAELRGSREIKGLGKFVASIPAWEYFRMRQKYGHDEVSSREFTRGFQKRYPHLSGIKV
jgi:hypothetical protein